MKKTILATTLALGLGVTGITAGQADASSYDLNKEELAYTAQNNPEALNASALHEGAYDYNFSHNNFNYDFNSDGTYYAWAYQSNGNAQAELPAQEQTAAPAVKEETQTVEQNNYTYEENSYTYTEEVQEPAQNTQTQAPAVEEVEEPAAPAPQNNTASTTNTNSGLNWGSLAACESGGNPNIVSANGMYHGLYQFDAQTWQSVGGSGVASDASAAEQTKRAQMLYDQRGSQPWPVCGANL
ncbi:putative transglycosylase SceD precursor [Jeotgalicoccus saudimassiliensis]|uniref:Putative transglycosylase SceD n=1 Tax=Jeotgalicoccus saudimassiliensis TaxID=1461582 RepID=A0A078M3I4_9STAP|nr:transglycosylase family protein [Jeotgalicoccus saudimassiliensis]CEA02118.1 putative transglycosylase SceD precursor [Jeotgalicoccus saudimassiliensis]